MRRGDGGQALVEYALTLGVLAIAVVLVAKALQAALVVAGVRFATGLMTGG